MNVGVGGLREAGQSWQRGKSLPLTQTRVSLTTDDQTTGLFEPAYRTIVSADHHPEPNAITKKSQSADCLCSLML